MAVTTPTAVTMAAAGLALRHKLRHRVSRWVVGVVSRRGAFQFNCRLISDWAIQLIPDVTCIIIFTTQEQERNNIMRGTGDDCKQL